MLCAELCPEYQYRQQYISIDNNVHAHEVLQADTNSFTTDVTM